MNKKIVEFEIEPYLLEQINAPIRGVLDIITLLVETLKYMLWQKPSVSTDCSLKVVVSKMNRIFYIQENKMFSITMPFYTKRIGERISFWYSDMEINSKLLSVITQILQSLKDDANSILQWEQYLEDFEIEQDEGYLLERIIQKLIFTEYGYIRYENDEVRANGVIHPQYHLDINSSNQCTYKIGLDSNIESQWFEDLLDITKPCAFIKE